jgi:hypothetical protein
MEGIDVWIAGPSPAMMVVTIQMSRVVIFRARQVMITIGLLATSRGSLLRPRQEYNKIVPVDSAKQRACLFVEKIAIDRAAGQ